MCVYGREKKQTASYSCTCTHGQPCPHVDTHSLAYTQTHKHQRAQAAFGRQALSLSSFFTYVGLGLGLLGSSLALPFGLYVIICQRSAEQYIKVCVCVCVCV